MTFSGAAKTASKILTGKFNRGYCVICRKETVFVEYDPWKRDFYKCMRCQSIPRQRAIINTLNIFFPDWHNLTIHESSPGGISSNFIRDNCKNFSVSHFFQDVELGGCKQGCRCENLEKMTFDDASFDLLVTQDVFEHIMDPHAAFSEIARVLKPGGAHVFTMPWYGKQEKSKRRAKLEDGKIVHLTEPVYHGNPIDASGSLVTYDWGRDFTDIIYSACGMTTVIYLVINRKLGLDAEFLEVFISRKSA